MKITDRWEDLVHTHFVTDAVPNGSNHRAIPARPPTLKVVRTVDGAR
jgi:hypothetical protein